MWKLVLFASTSKIQGAGMGLFIYHVPLVKQSTDHSTTSKYNNSEFILQPGEFVDLGIFYIWTASQKSL